MATMLDAALAYATKFGWPVLPVKGKAPIAECVPHGVKDASADRKTIIGWWTRFPTANIAIAIPRGILVVDIDPRNGGDGELAALQDIFGPLPATVTALTGGGGGHYVYTAHDAPPLRGKLRPGIDLLGAGRYFLVSPSVHPETGNRYSWAKDGHPLKVAPARVPDWILELAKAEEEPAPPTATSVQNTHERSDTQVLERASKYLASCEPAVSGQGGHNQTFMTAQRLVRGFALDVETALGLLVREWNPRCQPPWSERALRRKVQEALRVGTMAMGSLRDRRLGE